MSYKLLCPVPIEQRPITEYLKLRESKFLNSSSLNESSYLIKILKIFFISLILFFSFSFFYLDLNSSFLKLLITTSIISYIFILLIHLRLFLSWQYIKKRLNDPIIFYEESSWYDGKFWTKSKSILFQEKLIQTYQVLPIIKKIVNVLTNTCSILLTFLLILIFN
jgi:hypothetical protein